MKDLVIACVAAIALASQASAVSDIFSDAVIWRRGFVGEGLIPKESMNVFPEALKMGVPSDPSHETIVGGVYSKDGYGVELRKETVHYPYANASQEETVAYFSQTVIEDGGYCYPSVVDLTSPFVISNASDIGYTFFTRFRWDGTLPSAERKDKPFKESYFLTAGLKYSDANYEGTGIMVGVGENGAFRLAVGNQWHTFGTVCVPANKWVDCAVTVKSGEFKLYAYWDGCWGAYLKKLTQAIHKTGLNPDPSTVPESKCIRLGGVRRAWNGGDDYNGKIPSPSVDNNWRVFRGSIHSLVGWPRALSEYEIRQVFAYPKMDLVRLGTLNGNSKEFGGDGTADVVAGDSDSHAKMPSALTGECPSATIKFSVPSHLAGVNQILRVTPPSDACIKRFGDSCAERP